MSDAKVRSERYTAGMAVRRKVLGDAHVDRASAQTTPFDEDFQALHHRGRLGLGLVAAAAGPSASARS